MAGDQLYLRALVVPELLEHLPRLAQSCTQVLLVALVRVLSMSPRFVQQRLQFPGHALNLFAQLLNERLPNDREAKSSTVKIKIKNSSFLV